jgi:hypothetical protein
MTRRFGHVYIGSGRYRNIECKKLKKSTNLFHVYERLQSITDLGCLISVEQNNQRPVSHSCDEEDRVSRSTHRTATDPWLYLIVDLGPIELSTKQRIVLHTSCLYTTVQNPIPAGKTKVQSTA